MLLCDSSIPILNIYSRESNTCPYKNFKINIQWMADSKIILLTCKYESKIVLYPASNSFTMPDHFPENILISESSAAQPIICRFNPGFLIELPVLLQKATQQHDTQIYCLVNDNISLWYVLLYSIIRRYIISLTLHRQCSLKITFWCQSIRSVFAHWEQL